MQKKILLVVLFVVFAAAGSYSQSHEQDRINRTESEAAEKIFKEQGARAVMLEVIRTQEDPKYILLANNTLPETYKGKPLSEALKDDKTFRVYEHALQDKINSSTGEDRQMWQGQMDTIYGFRHALKVEEGVAAPRPATALGLNF